MDDLIYKTISCAAENSQVYKYRDSTWVIFKDNKEWIVSVSDNGYLWYNYSFFKNLFNYLSLELGDENIHIKNWVEKYLGIKVGNHYHPDRLPGEYDLSSDFDVNEVIERHEKIIKINNNI